MAKEQYKQAKYCKEYDTYFNTDQEREKFDQFRNRIDTYKSNYK